MMSENTANLRTIRRRHAHRGAVSIGLVIGVVVLVAAVAGVGLWGAVKLGGGGVLGDSAEQASQWQTVTRQDIHVNVVSEGELVAKNQVDVVSIIEHRDDPTIESVIEEGVMVQKGDWLYTLSAPAVEADYEEWQSEVRQAEADVVEAQRNLEIERDSAASAEAQARLTLELAQLEHRRWEEGTVPQRERELQLALEKAQRELEQAQREVVFSQELFDQGHLSQSELETDQIRLIEAENGLQSAELDMEVYNQFEKVKQEKEMLSAIEQAESELSRTLRKNANQLELLTARVVNEENQQAQIISRLERAQRYVDAMEMQAPSAGLVIYGSTVATSGWERRSPIRQGARIWGGRRVILLTDTTQMVANLRVHEAYISQVQEGQVVNIEITARPGVVIEGVVIEKKNSANQDGGGNPNVSEYLVLTELPAGVDDDLRPGMKCKGSIQIRVIPNVLVVSIQAVHTEGEDQFVYVPAPGGKVQRRIVRLGGASDTHVEIVSGLEEGDRVLLRNPRPGELVAGDASPDPAPTAEDPPAPAE